METGPIRVFGELIADRIFARAAEELLQESKEYGDLADCARYIVECAAHHARYPDSTQSFSSTVCLDAELEFKDAIPGDPTPNSMGETLKALYDEARAARDATNDNPTWDYLDRRCSKLAREIDDFMRGRDNAIQAGERVWYFGGWYQRRPSTQYPFRVEQWDAYDGVHHYLVDTAERAKSLIEERFAYARRGQ